MKQYKIGYTTGVFDLFHVGHLNILKRAKEQCDYLIVGVSTDELVIQYKNKKPIIPYNERAEIVSELRYVDKVVTQTNRDKFLAWRNLDFDVLFVGDDWKGTPEWIRFEEEFNNVGVEIVYLPYTQGTSSTKLREVIDIVLIQK